MFKGIFATALPALLIVLSAVLPAQAQFDDASRNLLIEKLEKVYLNLAPKDASKVAVTLRLADLYAERARVASMKELDSGCTVCKAGEADRVKALRLYTEVLDRAPEASQGKVLVQVGHLYQLTGQEDKAIGFYHRIISQDSNTGLKAEANLSLAEIHFKRRDFAKAKSFYEQVLKNPAANSRGLAAYRKAWSSFNLGQIDTAVGEIQEVLKTPALLTRNGAPNAQIDPQFHEEVSRDLATFLSKTRIGKKEIENLYKLSPESTRISNVMGLALDAERLGKKQEALETWSFVFDYLKKPEDRMNAQVSMAQLQYDLGNKTAALDSFSRGMQLTKDIKSCSTTQCDELRRRARQFVVNWNQAEKKTPSVELLTAYENFLANFPEDVDMNIYAAEVARHHNKFAVAAAYYGKAQALLATQQPKEAKKLETVLLSQIEVGETSKDEALTLKAYDSYLALSPVKNKAFEVQYQKARNQYEKGDYATSSVALRALALDPKGDAKIRKQAADLSLDALVLLKDESKIGVWANEYSQAFKEGGNSEFSQIAQKSVLSQSANLADKNAAAAYTELLKFDVSKASAEDRIKYHKNKLILAEKLKRYPEAQVAADDLLAEKGISAEDREFALARKAYMAEMTLDFATAMLAIEKLQTTLKPEEKALKLALFAELSGKNSQGYYTQYLKVAKDDEAKKLVAAELVRKSASPEKDIESFKPYLEKSPTLMAQLYSEAFAKNSSETILKKVIRDEKLKSTDSGKLLARLSFLKEFETLKPKITSHKLDTTNDRKLAVSIKARGQLLDKLEAMTKSAIESADWTSQLVSIDLLAKESDRFYQDLISAPMPEGLSPEEEGEYLNLLSAQAAPFQAKAGQAKVKVEQFWAQPNWLSSLKASWQHKELRGLIATEVAALKEIAPQNFASELSALTVDRSTATENKPSTKPSMKEIQSARMKVHKDPGSRAALEELLALEKKAENKPMVQYLQTRIETLNKGVN